MSTTIPCYICGQPVDASDFDNYTIILDDGNPKYFLHMQCSIRAEEIFKGEDQSEEILSLRTRINDLNLMISDNEEANKSTIDVRPLVDYLEELVASQTNNQHRAPPGSDYARLAAIRVNDATEALERIKEIIRNKRNSSA